MAASRILRVALLVPASVGAVVVLACNALVGNGDIQLATEAGTGDATTSADAPVDTTAADAAMGDGNAGNGPAADAAPDSPAFVAPCDAGSKLCNGTCVMLGDPGYGCGAARCNPCELPNAIAGCSPSDGGPDGGDFECAIAVCKQGHGDCNGVAIDGCEIDTAADLYNCGACGHDCSNLPHVAGNVACNAGACSFDDTACAPGYAVCTTNPDNGCDTVISAPAHCGGCATSCSDAGFPYCSQTGNPTKPFACTSGCTAALSLCGASCVNFQADPNHCGSCSTQCPSVVGGTPNCTATGCGFTCNASYHLCGAGSASTCAANNDPDNCGSRCGTNCPGPTPGSGSGVASCNGNACAVTCINGASLCGTACVNEQSDSANCGGCGNTCAAGQACAGGQCACEASGCPSACCNGDGTCAAGCPTTLAEAPSLALWLVGDSYASGAPTWADQSGQSAGATCSGSTCPQSTLVAAIGHKAVTFTGTSFFTLTDPNMDYASQSWTIFVVANPDPSATANSQLLAFSNGANLLGLGRNGSANDLAFTVLPGSVSNSIVAPGAWSGGAWESVVANVDATGNGSLVVGGATVTGMIGAPLAVDYASSYLGTDPTTTLGYTGQVAEVIVFTADLSSTSTTNLQAYLQGRYGL